MACALQFRGRGELAVTFAFEEIQVPVIAAREDIADAVAVEVHELWREADTSAKRHADDLATRLEPLELVKLGVILGADVWIKPELALAELSHE